MALEFEFTFQGMFQGLKKRSSSQSNFQKNVYRSQSFLNYTSSPYHKKKNIHASQVEKWKNKKKIFYNQIKIQISPCSIVVLLDGQQGTPASMTPTFASKPRPKLPPPPPPPPPSSSSNQLLTKSKISVQLPPNGYEIPNSQIHQQITDNMDNLSWKFDDFDSG